MLWVHFHMKVGQYR